MKKLNTKTLGIPVSPTFKSWVQGEMARLGVPTGARAEFLRGCLVFAIKASRRAKDPSWVAFATASEEAAVEKLGAKLALEGPRDIAALGFRPFFLEAASYSPSQVTKAEAREIDSLLAKARKRQLAFKRIGKVGVDPPKRTKPAGKG